MLHVFFYKSNQTFGTKTKSNGYFGMKGARAMSITKKTCNVDQKKTEQD
jgi:hypothetical protein